MTSSSLPPGFSDLDRWAPEWIFNSELARNQFRTRQPYARLEEFYHAVFPRLDAITEHLNQFSLDALPRDAGNLLELALMLMEVAPAIEYYQRADVPDSVPYEKYQIFSVKPCYRVLDATT